MNEEFTNRMLAVVEVTTVRPDRPAYHAKVQVLNSRVVADAETAGWTVVRIAAADVTPERSGARFTFAHRARSPSRVSRR